MFKLLPLFCLCTFAFAAEPGWVSATDEKRVTRDGEWRVDRFRYAAAEHLHSMEEGASLTFAFEGTAVAVRLGGHNVPAYRPPNLGRIEVVIDGKPAGVIRPRATPREMELARDLKPGRHTLLLRHRLEGEDAGCRIEGFRVWSGGCGTLAFTLSGEAQSHLVDARAVLRRDGKVVRDTLVRNWLTGQCALTGLPPGKSCSLEIRATGWQPARVNGITITGGRVTTLDPVYLKRDPVTVTTRFRFPALNRPAIRCPGETFRARFLGFDTTINEVRLTRRVGPAVISRKLSFKEDVAAKHYYDREIIVTLPKDMPPGAYDLSVRVNGGRRTGICRSPRSVHVIRQWPNDPVLVTFGHLDTSAQNQAEYLERLADMANLIAPDLVLNSNAVNPAYISGALARLDMPYVVNFGNHQFPGHEAWYGDPVGRVDFGPDLCVLNFGHLWFTDKSKAEALFAARPKARLKIINGFEANAPVDFLNRHRVKLIHDAHGIGKKVMDIGVTPTRRVGKVNAISFRVVRFKDGRVVHCTYNGHETAAYPFARDESPPLSVTFVQPNDGTHRNQRATITNTYLEPFPNARITLVMPNRQVRVSGGRLESTIISDDNKYRVLAIRTDVPAKDTAVVTIEPR